MFFERSLLAENAEIIPNVIRKSNSKRTDNTPVQNRIKQIERHHIETDISLIERYFPKKIHVTNVQGFYFKILDFMLAYNMETFFKVANQIAN
mgnify:CR=1 FL=1